MPVESQPTNSLRIAGTLLLLTRTLDQRVRKSLWEDGLDLVGLSTLSHVERGTDLPSLIARSLNLDPGRVTRVMDHLVELTYVERYGDETDRRRCRLRLTEAGQRRLEAGKAETVKVMSALLGTLSVQERANLEQGLEAVRKSLDLET
jgi:DNA-binding MarR family transcriptional regulator